MSRTGACLVSPATEASARQVEGTTSSVVTVVEANEVDSSGPPTLKLRLTEKKGSGETKPKPEKKGVKWTSETVDNEHLNKKKSKKCCIYKKPKRFDESDTESSEGSHDEDDCRHAGH